MARELNDHIRAQMQEKDTPELIEIWKKNDRMEWSEEAFEAIRVILVERAVELPAQNPETSSLAGDESEEQDVSYNFQRLTRVAFWASAMSWLFLGVAVLIAGINIWSIFQDFAQYSTNVVVIVSTLASRLLVALIGGFFFVLLQVIGEGVYILIDIEENTRMRPKEGRAV